MGFLLSDRVTAPQPDQNVSSNVVVATGILIDLQPPKQMEKSGQNPSVSAAGFLICPSEEEYLEVAVASA